MRSHRTSNCPARTLLHGDASGVRRRCRRAPRRHGLPVRRRAGDGHLPGAADAAAAAARGRAGHRQDRARRGDRRRRWTCRWSGCSATRGSTRPRRSTTGTSRARSCTCGRSRRPAARTADVEEAEKSLYDERFLLARPVLAALQQSPAVLLVDEVDRADDEFEAFLLEVLSTYQVTIPELGTVAAATPPVVVLTSNRTRELHDALKRRCLYHWIEHPGLEREVAIVRSRAPEVSEELARQVVGVVQQLRRRRAAEAARGRRDPRLGPRAAPPRHRRARPRVVGAHAGRAGEVPRGLPARSSRPSTRCSGHDAPPRPGARRDPARLRPRAAGRRASRSPRTARRASWRRSRWSGSTTRGRRTTPGRATLCASPDDLARYDQVHEAYFNAATGCPGRGRPRPSAPTFAGLPLAEADGASDGETPTTPVVRAMASDTEVLRHRDVASMSAAEKRRLAAMFATLRPRPPTPAYLPAPAVAPRLRRRARARCAPACAGWASPRTSRGGGAGTSRAASSC